MRKILILISLFGFLACGGDKNRRNVVYEETKLVNNVEVLFFSKTWGFIFHTKLAKLESNVLIYDNKSYAKAGVFSEDEYEGIINTYAFTKSIEYLKPDVSTYIFKEIVNLP